MKVDERVRPAAVYKPEVASLNMGSMNFGFFGMLNRFKKFEHDWERKHVENKDIVFRNTFQDIEYVLQTLSETGTRFEFECYDTAHLYNLATGKELWKVARARDVKSYSTPLGIDTPQGRVVIVNSTESVFASSRVRRSAPDSACCRASWSMTSTISFRTSAWR